MTPRARSPLTSSNEGITKLKSLRKKKKREFIHFRPSINRKFPYICSVFSMFVRFKIRIKHGLNLLFLPYRENGVNDVTIEILYCGICHTDLHQVRNDWGITMYPIVPGYVTSISTFHFCRINNYIVCPEVLTFIFF